jgi:hypothetical protein
MVVNPALWTIVNKGITFPSGDATLNQDQANEIQRNYKPYASSRVHSRPKSMTRWMGRGPPRKCGTPCSATIKEESK